MSAVNLSPARSPSAPRGARAAVQAALPPGTRFGEFEIIRVVGTGGFGIVYLAHDHTLERRVALKEYMPAALATRGEGRSLSLRTGPSVAETYAIGLRSFMNEARLLARFDHPSLVKVYRFWEENATAYMVMPFLQGITLRDARQAMTRSPDEAWIRSVIDPVLEALELLHRQGVYHLDVAPDNIMLPSEGPPILLDFGAARRVIGDRTQSPAAILKPGYAPIEQYAEMSAMRQGPWTDLYALGAVVHDLLFDAPPEPATARMQTNRSLPALATGRHVPGVSARMLGAVAWMLAVRPDERPQDVASVQAVLDGRIGLPAAAREPDDPDAPRVDSLPAQLRHAWRWPPTRRIGWFAAGGAAVALLVGAVLLWQFVDLLGSQRHAAGAAPLASARSGSAGAGSASRPGRSTAVAAPATTTLAGATGSTGVSGSTGATGATGSTGVGASLTAATPAAALASAASVVPAKSTVSASVSGGTLSGGAADAGRRVSLAASAPLMAPASAGSGPARPRTAKPARGDTGLASATADPYAGAAAATDGRPSPVTGDATAGATRGAAPAAVSAEPATARQACGSRVFIALALCMERECETPRYRGDAECVSVLEIKRNREARNQ